MSRTRFAACWAAAIIVAGGTGGVVAELARPGFPPVTSAAQVTALLHAAQFTDCGSSPAGGVTDAGSAYIGTEKIGINVFPDTSGRDIWVKLAADFGVVVTWQGPDWVAYRALNQSATPCP
jgi:hypothetical protein